MIKKIKQQKNNDKNIQKIFMHTHIRNGVQNNDYRGYFVVNCFTNEKRKKN